jgi:hypothetical protein
MSNNLDLSQVAANQDQKEVTINDQAGELDAAFTERLAVDLTSASVTLTDAQFRRNMLFSCSGNAVARTLTVPAIKRSLFIVKNGGTAALNVVRGSTSLEVLAGGLAVFATDGTTNGLDLVATSLIAGIYDLGFFVSGSPTDEELVLRLAVARAFTLPASLTGSTAKAKTASTGSASFEIQQDSVAIGTINFTAGNTTGSFTFASATTFAAGSILEIYAPATADATLADISVTFLGSR